MQLRKEDESSSEDEAVAPHDEDPAILALALGAYQRSKYSIRRRKAASESGITRKGNGKSDLPVMLDVSVEEAQGVGEKDSAGAEPEKGVEKVMGAAVRAM